MRANLLTAAVALTVMAVPGYSLAQQLQQEQTAPQAQQPTGPDGARQQVMAELRGHQQAAQQAYQSLQQARGQNDPRALGEARRQTHRALAALRQSLARAQALPAIQSDSDARRAFSEAGQRVEEALLALSGPGRSDDQESFAAFRGIQQATGLEVQGEPATVAVDQGAPEVQVQQVRPEVSVQQPAPQVVVEQAPPQVTVKQNPPRIVVRYFPPEVTVRQFEPEIIVRQRDPEVMIEQPDPEVSIQQAEPRVAVQQARPEVQVQQAPPRVAVRQPEPEIEVTQPEPRVQTTPPSGAQAMTAPENQQQQSRQTQQPQQRADTDPTSDSEASSTRPAPVQTAEPTQTAPTRTARTEADQSQAPQPQASETTGTSRQQQEQEPQQPQQQAAAGPSTDEASSARPAPAQSAPPARIEPPPSAQVGTVPRSAQRDPSTLPAPTRTAPAQTAQSQAAQSQTSETTGTSRQEPQQADSGGQQQAAAGGEQPRTQTAGTRQGQPQAETRQPATGGQPAAGGQPTTGGQQARQQAATEEQPQGTLQAPATGPDQISPTRRIDPPPSAQVGAVPRSAQREPSTLPVAQGDQPGGMAAASMTGAMHRIVGREAVDPQGTTVGTVRDVLLSQDGSGVEALVIALEEDSRLVRVPFSGTRIDSRAEEIVLPMPRDEVMNAPAFTGTRRATAEPAGQTR
ncbi:PRC-barrel domain-containing protein [Rhodocista pekingensis]|uniref:PRC-barrel domain-containing protein n=1 Tax=Rhodocista pekingensis TaxID=201185 RepID=A0ABW2KP04_9PROT